jgi:hypothetical protein
VVALLFAGAAVALFVLHSFAFLVVLLIGAVFAIGAAVAKMVADRSTTRG